MKIKTPNLWVNVTRRTLIIWSDVTEKYEFSNWYQSTSKKEIVYENHKINLLKLIEVSMLRPWIEKDTQVITKWVTKSGKELIKSVMLKKKWKSEPTCWMGWSLSYWEWRKERSQKIFYLLMITMNHYPFNHLFYSKTYFQNNCLPSILMSESESYKILSWVIFCVDGGRKGW